MNRIAIILLAVFAGLLYGFRLDYAPPHLEIDEVLIALDAHAIATTGHDMRGELLPLYSQTAEHSWYQPFVIYVTALALKMLPLTEWAIRVPTVCIAVLDVVLIYVAARHLLQSGGFGVVAAILLALTPAHFIHSRYAMDYLYPVPFVLGWLICLVVYDERRRTGMLALGVTLLGAGFYSYIASMVMMPLYFAMTCALLYRERAPGRSYGVAAAAFLPWLLPFAVWLTRHPGAYRATIEKYGLYDPNRLDAVQAMRSAFGYASVSERIGQYWNYFNPSFLFFGSGTKLMFSTNLAGVFLLAAGALLAVGIYRVVRSPRPIEVLVLAGFFTAPLAALIVAEENAIFRALALLPFGILLATIGARAMWTGLTAMAVRMPYRLVGLAALLVGGAYASWTLISRGRLTSSPVWLIVFGAAAVTLARLPDPVRQWRIAAACLLALIPVQFAGFWSDYFSDYRVRSSYWLGGNIRGALEEIIERDSQAPVPAVYFSTLTSTGGQVDGRDQYIAPYWRFYLLKHHRENLLARARPFEAAHVDGVAPGSLVLANDGNPTTDRLVGTGELKRVASIPELNGAPFFAILQR